MQLHSLGYMGLNVSDLAAWQRFSRRLLGTQSRRFALPDGREAVTLRLDEKCHRFILTQAEADGAHYFGLELADAAALEAARRQLADAGVPFTEATRDELALRRVRQMIWLRDPDGNRVELYHGLEDAAEPFVPDRPLGGFRTGELGMGHIVLIVAQLERARDFYCKLLGFRVSDYVLEPNRRVFMRINGRHHSLALGERAGSGIAHVMVEVNEFDDVGRAYDVAQTEYASGIFSTLGRHSNDLMTSFYVKTPSGFPIEYGWGGRVVDEASWQIEELFGPSLWGHDRIGGAAEARSAADQQREYALEQGIRAPLQWVGATPADEYAAAPRSASQGTDQHQSASAAKADHVE
ncbi:MAG: VOC family protein [Burkholderiales bacterium]|nr:VOC family protein [Burkholderiales bacterium]